MRTRTIFLLTLLTIALQIYCANPRRYITQNGSGLRDGSSWENAGGAEDLEDIIDSIQDADFWIAKGTYKPSRYVYDPEDERDMTFLPNHNFIYGGFAGNETDLSQRDIKANETIFSGDIGIEGDNSDNCYHVMRAVRVLDGVTICNGNANGSYNPNSYGGGVYVWGYDSVFRNCTFRDNYASQQGGAVFMDSWGYDVTFENCLFYNNGTNYGGGGAILSYRENTLITNCTFVKNTTENGSCVDVQYRSNDDVLISNNIFWNNTGGNLGYLPYIYSVSHNAIEGGYEGFANINLSSENAGFKNSPYFTDPDNHDYSLQSLSPCIDTGVYWNTSCDTDITGSLRPQGKSWDIGAYEYNSGPLTAVPPDVSTLSPEFTTVSTAMVRGNVTDDGGSRMITKGVYYSTFPGFDLETEGTLVKYNEIFYEGEFYIDITNLTPGTTFFYRIFCENRVGTAIGEEMSFNTRSGVNPDANGILYAKPDGTGDGSSWANALHGNDLQLGIDHADVKQLWLAKGKYVPTNYPNGGTIERQKHFALKPDLKLYGGFTGTETALEQRDFRNNKTILSGDIGAEGDYLDNAYHVFYHLNQPDIDSTSVLDGVTISDGNAVSLARANSDKGGGIYNGYSSPTIRNCTFENNRAIKGGGIYNSYRSDTGRSEPKIYNTIITKNIALEFGGGIYNNGAAPYLINCVITYNEASSSGGGIYHFAEDYIEFGTYSNTDLVHCTIAGNTSFQGSQIVFSTDHWNSISVYNSVIWGEGENIVWLYTNSEPSDWPRYTLINFCAVPENYQNIGEGNIILSLNNSGDINSPYFTDPSNNDYSLLYNSACKDMASYRYASSEDIKGIARPQGMAYDIGAYEFETAEPVGEAPVIQTTVADQITASSAMCNADIVSNTGGNLTIIGASVSETDDFDPETEGLNYYYSRDISENHFSALVSALKSETQYYFRPYAENRMGYSYGQQDSLMTGPGVSPDENGIVYVKTDGMGDGSSWANALNGFDLQTAIDHDSTKQVWVAKGVYKPNSWPNGGESEREMQFAVNKNIALYGGFAGNETDISERNIKANETLLSGDIGIENYASDNTYNILYSRTPTSDSLTVEIDGFTFAHGYNEGFSYLSPIDLWNHRSVVRNCIFRDNFCTLDGGAVYIAGDIASFDKCEFYNNTASELSWGGALFNRTHDVSITNSIFHNNVADNNGGAVGFFEGFNANIKNCLFYSNKAKSGGNAIGIIDMYNISVSNCTFSSNFGEVSDATAIYAAIHSYSSITNCVMWNEGNEIRFSNEYAINHLNNCAIVGEIDFNYVGENNIVLSPNNTGDPNSPYFSDPDRNHWWIQEASPLRNAGIWTTDVPLFDIAGFPRGEFPSIGCYEYDPSSIEDSESLVPMTTKLYQNYPNPFNPATNIKFSIAKAGKVELTVYNVLGQVVAKLVEKDLKAGNHSVVFNADAFNSGVYYYTLEVDGKSLTKRMLMVK